MNVRVISAFIVFVSLYSVKLTHVKCTVCAPHSLLQLPHGYVLNLGISFRIS